jgi:hypothetical protein
MKRLVGSPQGAAEEEALAECAHVLQCAAGCFGPRGRPRWVGAAGELSSASARVLPALARAAPRAPLGRLLLELVAAQARVQGDHGLWAAMLAARLVRGALERGVPARALAAATGAALRWCRQAVQPPCAVARAVRLDDLAILLAVARSALVPKCGTAAALSASEVERLALVCVQALISGLSLGCGAESGATADSGPGAILNVRYFQVLGRPPSESHVLKQELVLDLPLAPELAAWAERHLAGTRPGESDEPWPVLLLDASLLLDGRDAAAGLDVAPESSGTGAGARWTLREAQEAWLLPLGEAVVASGARVVLAQRLVHGWLKRWLLLRGVLTVERVSALHLAAVQTLTGARVLSGLPESLAPEMELCAAAGVLQRVSLLRVAGGRHFLRLTGRHESSGPRLCTVVLCGRDQLALAETQHACEQVLKLLRAFAEEPVVLAGRGAAEMTMARAVRVQCARWVVDQQRQALDRRQLLSENEHECERDRERERAVKEDGKWARHLGAALELFADSLEGLAAVLQPISGRIGALSTRDVLEALRAAPPPAGWDPVCECAVPAGLGPGDVLDSSPAKLSALSIATDAANVLLRIKGVVQA